MSTATTPDVITVAGRNLVDELIGRTTFTDMIGLVTTGAEFSAGHRAMMDALLVTFTDHGVTPSSMAARLTLLGAPEAMQAAVAAGLCGAGSRFLGTLENSARELATTVAAHPDEDVAQLASIVVDAAEQTDRAVIGIGHPEHKHVDPRVPRLLEIADQHDLRGRCTALLLALPGEVQARRGRLLPVNAAGLAGALLADMGYSPSFARGIALISRTAGLVGQLLDEETSNDARALWDRERNRSLHETQEEH